MIAKAILIVAIIALAVVLVRALIKGRIEFNPAGRGMAADRATEPGSFWTIFLIGTGAMSYLVWLVFGA